MSEQLTKSQPTSGAAKSTKPTSGAANSATIAQIALTCAGGALDALKKQTEYINSLNVFPVPDGDTGTNIQLTVESVIKELSALPQAADIEAVCEALTHGSLMGARGNSGVITSQILRGLAEVLEQEKSLSTRAIATAWARAKEVAFNAVRVPVAGTMLTVVEDIAAAAENAHKQGLTPDESWETLSKAAHESVARTPELLEVLRENNVVDAGGFGIATLLDGFIAGLTGKTVVTSIGTAAAISAAQSSENVEIELINDWDDDEFLYCTEFLFTAEKIDDAEVRDFLAAIGGSELFVGAAPQFKVHVHTNTPGVVLNFMTDRGQVAEVHIHNMRLQSAERSKSLHDSKRSSGSQDKQSPRSVNSDNQSDKAGNPQKASNGMADSQRPVQENAVIAAAVGAGAKSILQSLGVDYIIEGGQTMNPSTQDFVDATLQIPAKNYIFLPSNKNIIMAATSAAQHVSNTSKIKGGEKSKKAKTIRQTAEVVPTTSVLQSLSAMLGYEPDGELADNVENMQSVADGVRSAEITHAVKTSHTIDKKPIKTGDVIGLADGAVKFVGKNIEKIALEIVKDITDDGMADNLTILYGADYEDKKAHKLAEKISKIYPDLEIDCQEGGQPLYPLLISAE